MINRKLLEWDDMRISDDDLAKIESVLHLTVSDRDRPVWRGALQQLVQDYILTWTFRPISTAERSTPEFKRAENEAKRRDKRQEKLQSEIARTFEKVLSLMFEELKSQGRNSLLDKFCDLHRDGEALYRNVFKMCALSINAVQHEMSVRSVRVPKRGRPADGLSEFIRCFGKLAGLGGHPHSARSDPDRNERIFSPFVIATKLLIDALPVDCPKLAESAIADRIKDEKLLAGLTRQKSDPRPSRTKRSGGSTTRG